MGSWNHQLHHRDLDSPEGSVGTISICHTWRSHLTPDLHVNWPRVSYYHLAIVPHLCHTWFTWITNLWCSSIWQSTGSFEVVLCPSAVVVRQSSSKHNQHVNLESVFGNKRATIARGLETPLRVWPLNHRSDYPHYCMNLWNIAWRHCTFQV